MTKSQKRGDAIWDRALSGLTKATGSANSKDATKTDDYVTQTEYNEKINGMEERLKTQEKYVSRLLQINTKNLPFTRGGRKKTRKNKKSTKGKAKKTRRRS